MAAKQMDNSFMAPMEVKFRDLKEIEREAKKSISPSKYGNIPREKREEMRDQYQELQDGLP